MNPGFLVVGEKGVSQPEMKFGDLCMPLRDKEEEFACCFIKTSKLMNYFILQNVLIPIMLKLYNSENTTRPMGCVTEEMNLPKKH